MKFQRGIGEYFHPERVEKQKGSSEGYDGKLEIVSFRAIREGVLNLQFGNQTEEEKNNFEKHIKAFCEMP